MLITQWPKYINIVLKAPQWTCIATRMTPAISTHTGTDKSKAKNQSYVIAAYVARNPSSEAGFKKGFKVWGSETKKQSLIVDVEEDSGAVYLCAASFHSV